MDDMKRLFWIFLLFSVCATAVRYKLFPVGLLSVSSFSHVPVFHNGLFYVAVREKGLDGKIKGQLKAYDLITATAILNHEIAVCDDPLGLITKGDFGYIVCDGENGEVWVIDLVARELVKKISVGKGPSEPLFYEGVIWIANREGAHVVAINCTTLKTKTIEVGRWPQIPTVYNGFVFVANADSGTVSQIDPTGMKVVREFKVSKNPRRPVFQGGHMYCMDLWSGELIAINLTTNKQLSLKLGNHAQDLLEHNGDIFVLSPGGQLHIVRGFEKIQVIEVGNFPLSPAFIGNRLYAGSDDGVQVFEETDEGYKLIDILNEHRTSTLNVDGNYLYIGERAANEFNFMILELERSLEPADLGLADLTQGLGILEGGIRFFGAI